MGYPLQYSWASLVAQLVKNLPACGRRGFNPWVGKVPWRRARLPTPVFRPGEFHGLYSAWDHKESDMTERLSLHFTSCINSSHKPLELLSLFPIMTFKIPVKQSECKTPLDFVLFSRFFKFLPSSTWNSVVVFSVIYFNISKNSI